MTRTLAFRTTLTGFFSFSVLRSLWDGLALTYLGAMPKLEEKLTSNSCTSADTKSPDPIYAKRPISTWTTSYHLMKDKRLLFDAVTYFSAFMLISTVALTVNLATGTVHALSGNIAVTVFTTLLVIRYRWQGRVRGSEQTVALCGVAGGSAVAFLIALQAVSPFLENYNFDPLHSQEALLSFILNALACSVTLFFRWKYRDSRNAN